MATIPELWRRIEQAFAAQRPDDEPLFRSPATQAAIAAAEQTLCIRFPDDFRASLLVHDGQDDDTHAEWLPVALRLGSLASIVKCWQRDRDSYAEPDEEVLDDEKKYARSTFIPLTFRSPVARTGITTGS